MNASAALKGPSRLTWLLIAAVLLAIAALIVASRAGAFGFGSGHGTITVTAPQPSAPVVTVQKLDDGTMAQLNVVKTGANFGSWAKLLILTFLQMLIYAGFGVLALGLGLYKTHFGREAGRAVMTTAGVGIVGAFGLAAIISYLIPHLMGAAFGGIR